MNRKVSGTIKLLCCSACSFRFPIFVFSGETDTATAGLVSFTDPAANAIQILEVGVKTVKPGPGKWLETKFSHLNDVTPALPGESFQSFVKRRKEPMATYFCLSCAAPSAEVTGEMSPEEFVHRGNQLMLGERLEFLS